MSDRVTTYNPRKVTCSLGSHIVSGFADDSFITIEPATDGTTYVQGADGEIVRSVDPSDLYTIKIALQQTSKTNDFLRKKYEKDKIDGGGTFPISIADILGNEKFEGSIAWPSKPASWARGKQQNNREWEIVCKGKFR